MAGITLEVVNHIRKELVDDIIDLLGGEIDPIRWEGLTLPGSNVWIRVTRVIPGIPREDDPIARKLIDQIAELGFNPNVIEVRLPTDPDLIE